MESYYLIVDDDETYRNRLIQAFITRGLPTLGAASLNEVIEISNSLFQSGQNIIGGVVDLILEGFNNINKNNGLSVVSAILKKHPQADLLILTGFGTINTAVEAIKIGAKQYLTKPAPLMTIFNELNIKPTSNNFNNQIESNQIPPLHQVEWEHIQRVLELHNGNISVSSKALGLPRRTLQRKLKKDPGKLS